MYDYKARMYSPNLGRFMQTDPVGYGDGLNWYNYVDGDPLNLKDPTGRDVVVDGNPCNFGNGCISIDIGDLNRLVRYNGNQIFAEDGDIIVVAKKTKITNLQQKAAPSRNSSFYCNAKVGLGIGLDVAGTVASAIPGTGQALVAAQLSLSAASAIYSGVTHNSQGTAVAGAAYGLTLGGLDATGGKALERAIPIVGAVLGAAQTYSDVKTAQEDYEKCLNGE